jgi:dihydroorotate dehydrogenase electron transfer subunit
MGAPPLEHLAQMRTANHKEIEPIAFVGAKSKGDLPFERQLDNISQELEFWLAEFGRYVVRSLVATDDGSSGFKGTVTNCLLDWFSRNSPNLIETIIYACGPTSMLASVAKVAADKKIDCQVSMEEMMACGIGLCQSCAVKCVAPAGGGIPAGGKGTNSGDSVYKLCCKDGPIFDARQIVF